MVLGIGLIVFYVHHMLYEYEGWMFIYHWHVYMNPFDRWTGDLSDKGRGS